MTPYSRSAVLSLGERGGATARLSTGQRVEPAIRLVRTGSRPQQCSLGRGRVEQPKLDALGPIEPVHAERSRGMHALSTQRLERIAELLPRGAEGDRLNARA